MRTRLQERKLLMFRKSEMLNKEIMEGAREFHLPRCNFAATANSDLIILKDSGLGNAVTYLTPKKGYLVLHEPLLIKTYRDIKQLVT